MRAEIRRTRKIQKRVMNFAVGKVFPLKWMAGENDTNTFLNYCFESYDIDEKTHEYTCTFMSVFSTDTDRKEYIKFELPEKRKKYRVVSAVAGKEPDLLFSISSLISGGYEYHPHYLLPSLIRLTTLSAAEPGLLYGSGRIVNKEWHLSVDLHGHCTKMIAEKPLKQYLINDLVTVVLGHIV